MATLECKICYDKKKRVITCPSCAYVSCFECQHTYDIPSCANCSTGYTRTYLHSIDKQLVKTLYRPYHEKVYWEREKALLSRTQTWVDWEIMAEKIKAQLRFGFKIALPPKPTQSISSIGTVFPCPSLECRGFVQGSKCGNCKKDICIDCREIQVQNHVCDINVIENIKALATDTKPCPSCSAFVFKTEGCNHMFCTHCRTHFDWVTKRILVSSTNHHYDRTTEFAKNIAKLSSGNTCTDQNTHTDAILSKLIPKQKQKHDLYRILYEESKQARQMLLQLYDIRKIMESHETLLIQLRIKFLRNQLNEDQIKAKIFIAESSVQKKIEYAQLLTMFLSVTNDIQVKWSQAQYQNEEQLLIFMNNLIKMCEEESIHIQEEFGGSRIKFHDKWQIDSLPMITMD